MAGWSRKLPGSACARSQRPYATTQFVVPPASLVESRVPLVRSDLGDQFDENVLRCARFCGHGNHHGSRLHNVMRRWESIRPETVERNRAAIGLFPVLDFALQPGPSVSPLLVSFCARDVQDFRGLGKRATCEES